MGYKEIKEQLNFAKEQVMELTDLLRKKCPHNEVIEEWYVEDDYATRKSYTCTYKCEYCGLYASYNKDNNQEKSKDFIKLEQTYNKKHSPIYK